MINQIKNILNQGQLQIEVFDNPGKETKGMMAVTVKMSTIGGAVTVNRIKFEILEHYQRGRLFKKRSQHLVLGMEQIEGPWTVGIEVPVLIDVLIPYFKSDSILESIGKHFLLKPIVRGINIIENVNSTYNLTLSFDIKNRLLPKIHDIVLSPERMES